MELKPLLIAVLFWATVLSGGFWVQANTTLFELPAHSKAPHTLLSDCKNSAKTVVYFNNVL